MKTEQSFQRKPSEIILDTVMDYFSPWTDYYKKKNDKCNDRLDAVQNAIKLLGNAVCYNQARLVQFIFLATEKHKELKKASNAYEADADEKKFQILQEKFDGLYQYVQSNFNKAAKGNFLFLLKYFEDRGEFEPRITVRGKALCDGKEALIPLLTNYNEYPSAVNIKTSTAYKHIQDNGLYFLENDIPKAAAQGRYNNNRLDIDRVKDLLSPYLSKGEKVFSRKVDEMWDKCWKSKFQSSQNDVKRYYKSTLIIPITLSNRDLEKEFIHYLNEKIDNTDVSGKDIERTIFGFLCFDNVERGYFKKDDVRIAYQFADMISLYLFVRMMLVEISGTFSKTYNLFKEMGLEKDLDPYTYVHPDEIRITEWPEETKGNYIADVYKYDSKPECPV